MRCRDVKVCQVVAAPCEIGGDFWSRYNAYARAVWIEYMDAPRAAAVQVAGAVDFHAVGHAGLIAVSFGPAAAVGDAAVFHHIENTNVRLYR